MSNNKWALLENGYTHTSNLSELDAIEMQERYSRVFPDLEYCIIFIN
jgi:hypothetical protein